MLKIIIYIENPNAPAAANSRQSLLSGRRILRANTTAARTAEAVIYRKRPSDMAEKCVIASLVSTYEHAHPSIVITAKK
jgi:hypothetical protein